MKTYGQPVMPVAASALVVVLVFACTGGNDADGGRVDGGTEDGGNADGGWVDGRAADGGDFDGGDSGVACNPKAFPGAEGFGASTAGGRGGAVCEVTSLANAGAGSLRDCIEKTSGPRTIVFRVGGTISLDSTLALTDSNVTIVGQTAPGGGIQLKHYGLAIGGGAHDIVVRHMRIRPGRDNKDRTRDVDALETAPSPGNRVYNVVLDHCSFEYGFDEVVSAWGNVSDVTLQYCIVANSMAQGQNGEFAKGILIGGDRTYGTNATRFTMHHNLIASNGDRNPRVIYGVLDLRNNVIYNWQGNGSTLLGNPANDGSTGRTGWEPGPTVNANVVGNFWKKGPITYASYNDVGWVEDHALRIFSSGNYSPRCPSGCANDWDIGWSYWDGTSTSPVPESPTRVSTPFATPPVTTQAVPQMTSLVLAKAGGTAPARDALDQGVIDDFNNGTGALAPDVPFYPALAAGTAPVDTDHDGMPDVWEQAHGLNPTDPSDRNGTSVNGCYTNLEAYLSELAGDGT